MICDIRHFERILHKVHHSVMHVVIYDTRGRDHSPYHLDSVQVSSISIVVQHCPRARSQRHIKEIEYYMHDECSMQLNRFKPP